MPFLFLSKTNSLVASGTLGSPSSSGSLLRLDWLQGQLDLSTVGYKLPPAEGQEAGKTLLYFIYSDSFRCILFLFGYACVWEGGEVCALECSACEIQKRVSDPGIHLSCLTWVLGMELGSFGRAASTLSCWAIFHALLNFHWACNIKGSGFEPAAQL